MFVMAIAVLEAYSYTNYVVRGKNKFGSIFYIIKDVFYLFMAEIRLFKPKNIGFQTTSDSQTELLTISNVRTAQVEVKINRSIESSFISHYF
jgi:hypothetical protein